jgi:hypothetical protein
VQARRDMLPPETKVNFAAEREAAGIDDVLRSLEEDLVGLQPVKDRIAEIASLLLVDRVRQRFGLQAPRPSLHMCFTGSPGTGKTTVGLRMADLLKRLGYLDEGQLRSPSEDRTLRPAREGNESRSSEGQTRATGRDEWTPHHLGAWSAL